jgi:predicted enzyme related to lactoylglutathione lyase
VDDVAATLARLLELGATALEPMTERGPGYVTASVLDPFRNVVGVMENAHYRDALASLRR